MRRRRLYLILAAILLLGVLAYAIWPNPPEPIYGGRTLSQWLEEYDSTSSPTQRITRSFSSQTILSADSSNGGYYLADDSSNRGYALTSTYNLPQAQAADAVRNIGTNAVPWLLKWSDYEWPNPRVEFFDKVARAIRWLGINWDPRPPPVVRRARNSWVGFLILGDQAQSAIPELAARLKKGRARAMTQDALASIGTYTARLVLLTNATDIQTQSTLVLKIKEWDARAAPAIPALRQVMASALTWEARQAASNGLWQIENMQKR